MPNYKLTPRYTGELIHTAKSLIDRRLRQMLSGFPLGFDELQRAILPAGDRETLLNLSRRYPDPYRPFNRSSYTMMYIEHPEIPRTVIASAISTDGSEKFLDGLDQCAVDFSTLPLDKATALVEWANTAVGEKRVSNLALQTVIEFLKLHGKSTGEITARWPALAMLADKAEECASTHCRHSTNMEIRRMWKHKFSEPPRLLKPYRWTTVDEPWRQRYKRAMELTELVLVGATMLPSEIKDGAELQVNIEQWVPLPGDLDKP